MGGGGGSTNTGVSQPTVNPSPYEQYMANIAHSLWKSSKPIRSEMIGGWMDFLNPKEGTEFNAASLPGYTPMYDVARRGLESQYSTARNQAIAGTPRGGAMSDALAQIEKGRAESVGQLPGQISSGLINDQMNKAYGAAFNLAPTQALGGLGAANQGYTATQNSLINAQMQQNAIDAQSQQANQGKSGLGMLGSGLGTVVGSAFGGPAGGAAGGALGGGLGGKK